jgi:hypothetical protein
MAFEQLRPYRVAATKFSYYAVDIEAVDEDHARELAEEAVLGDWFEAVELDVDLQIDRVEELSLGT